MHGDQILCKDRRVHETGRGRETEIIVAQTDDLIADTPKSLLLPFQLGDVLLCIAELCLRTEGQLLDDLVTVDS